LLGHGIGVNHCNVLLEAQKVKQPKLSIFLVVIALLSGLIVVAAYNSFSSNVSPANTSASTSQPLQLQILSPEENYTYGTYNAPLNITADEAAHMTTYSLELPLNITANNATAKITYSLDGAENVTFNENTTTTINLTYGVHSIAVYGFVGQSKVSESKNVTFTVGFGYQSTLELSMQQVQETISYFESRGLKVQVLDESKPQNLLYAGSVDVFSKEALANFAIANRINVIYEVLDSNYVGFCADYYNNSWLPIVYTYSATVG
jgi:hypothetical protein